MAHRKPLGTECTLTYDTGADVEPFDVIRTEPAGTCYRVLSVRAQEGGKWAGIRKHLNCVRIAGSDVEEGDRVHPLYWYSRERRRERSGV